MSVAAISLAACGRARLVAFARIPASRPGSSSSTLDLVEREADGRLVVVDLKTAARKYTEDQASYCRSFRAWDAHSGYRRRSR